MNRTERAIRNVYAVALIFFMMLFGAFCSMLGAFLTEMLFMASIPGAVLGAAFSTGAVTWVSIRHWRTIDGQRHESSIV